MKRFKLEKQILTLMFVFVSFICLFFFLVWQIRPEACKGLGAISVRTQNFANCHILLLEKMNFSGFTTQSKFGRSVACVCVCVCVVSIVASAHRLSTTFSFFLLLNVIVLIAKYQMTKIRKHSFKSLSPFPNSFISLSFLLNLNLKLNLMGKTLAILIFINIFVQNSHMERASKMLWKPKTIVVPVVANLGGSVVPLGDTCTVSMDIFLDKFNQQSQFLPDYNLVVEITDDECSEATAVERFIPEYINWKSHVNLTNINREDNGTRAGQMKTYVPNMFEFEHQQAANAIRVPFFSGPLCSGPCKAISQYPQYFNIIEATVACLSPKLDNRKLYPNFYRLFPSAA